LRIWRIEHEERKGTSNNDISSLTQKNIQIQQCNYSQKNYWDQFELEGILIDKYIDWYRGKGDSIARSRGHKYNSANNVRSKKNCKQLSVLIFYHNNFSFYFHNKNIFHIWPLTVASLQKSAWHVENFSMEYIGEGQNLYCRTSIVFYPTFQCYVIQFLTVFNNTVILRLFNLNCFHESQ